MKAVLYVAALLFCGPAFGRFGVSPFDVVVGTSDIIVDATIQRAQVADYRYRDYSAVCGYVYEARVTESFKGDAGPRLVFASNLALAEDTRHLLFLRNHDGDFPSDQGVSMEDPDDPDFGIRVDEARRACVAGLPRLKGNSLHHGEVVLSQDRRSHYVGISRWIGDPPGLAATTIRLANAALDGTIVPLEDWPATAPAPLGGAGLPLRFIEWNALRAWLHRHVEDIVDTPPSIADCDAACLASTLRETDAVMERNLAALRDDGASRPGARRAVAAAQSAWSRYVQASCETWQRMQSGATGRPRPASACRLWFTQVRSRELWLQRNAPLSAQGPSIDEPCHADCVEARLEEVATEVNHRMRVPRRGEASDRAGVAALIDAARTAWETYERSNCLTATSSAQERMPGVATQWCRLRLAEEWLSVTALWENAGR